MLADNPKKYQPERLISILQVYYLFWCRNEMNVIKKHALCLTQENHCVLSTSAARKQFGWALWVKSDLIKTKSNSEQIWSGVSIHTNIQLIGG